MTTLTRGEDATPPNFPRPSRLDVSPDPDPEPIQAEAITHNPSLIRIRATAESYKQARRTGRGAAGTARLWRQSGEPRPCVSTLVSIISSLPAHF